VISTECKKDAIGKTAEDLDSLISRMYVETKEKMDQEVNEATAALKGMLGIGNTQPVADSPTETTTTDPPKQGDDSPQGSAQSSKKKKTSKKKKKTSEQQNKQQQEGNDDSKKDRSNSNKKSKQKKKKNEKQSPNFAWSAFQSSPDASKLPIPEFSSPTTSGKKTVSVEDKEAIVSVPLNPAHTTTVTEQSATDVKANTSTDFTEGTTSPDTTTPEEDPRSEAPVSKTGINLAVLASIPPAPKQEHVTKTVPPQSVPGQVMQGNHPMPFSAPPPMSTFQQHHHPGYSGPQHYGPMPPPGFVTIQVQVPPVLMPGRQMVVTSPAGYPVQVAVPDNIPPGAIIPVHVPAGPPMHMMPPQAPYGGRYYNNPGSR